MRNPVIPDIEHMPLFCDLQKPARRYLQSRLKRFHFSAGQEILQQGKRGEFIGLVGHGLVDLEKQDGNIQTLLPGEMFGEQMLLFKKPSPYTIRARSDSSMWVITRSDWLKALQIPVPLEVKTTDSRSRRFPFRSIAAMILLASALIFLSPELPQQANRLIIQSLRDANLSNLAESYIKLNIQIQPDSAPLYEELGSLYFQNGDYVGAGAAFQEAVNREASSVSALNNFGAALLSVGQPQEALIYFLNAAELDPGNPEIYFNQGNTYLALGETENAAEAFRRAAELDPQYLGAKVQLGYLLMEQGKFPEAMLIWEEILYWSPEQTIARRGRGMLAVLDSRPQESIPDLEAALLANPLDPVSHLYLGLALASLENPAAAATEFEAVKVLSKDPALIAQADYHLREIAEIP